MRRAIFLIALVGALAAPPAQAYKSGGDRWPGGVVRYHSSAPAYKQAITDAVRAWNASGARVRLKAASRARANLQIRYATSLNGFAGIATLGYESQGLVTFQLLGGGMVDGLAGGIGCGKRLRVPADLPGPKSQRLKCLRGPHMLLLKPARAKAADRQERLNRALTVTHEFGHVLNLQHNQPACAVMSYQREARCSKPQGAWQARCRLLESDDVRGVIARYGGRMKALAPPFCDLAPAPRGPVGLTAALDADNSLVRVRWARVPGDTTVAYRIKGTFAGCPTVPPEGPFGAPSGAQLTDTVYLDEPFSGTFCVAVWHEDVFGRLVGPETVKVPVAPAPQPTPDPYSPEPTPEPYPPEAS